MTGSTPRLATSDRLQPVLLLASIAAGLAIGWLAPRVASLLTYGVSIGVFALITLVMLNVSPRGVAGAFRQRRFLGAAVFLNFVVNPAIAWGLGSVFLRSEPDLRIGLILFLVTPCIGWYLVFTELAGGDTELGVGLLAVNVVLQVLLLPLYVALLIGDSASIGLAVVIRSVVLYLAVPAVVAGLIHRWWAVRQLIPMVEHERLRLSMLKTIALVVVIVSMFASQADAIFDDIGAVGRLIVPMVAFFAVAFFLALMTARSLQLPDGQRVLLAFTTTSRNSEASLAIAATAFASPLVGLTVALGPAIELPLLVLMVRVLRRREGSLVVNEPEPSPTRTFG